MIFSIQAYILEKHSVYITNVFSFMKHFKKGKSWVAQLYYIAVILVSYEGESLTSYLDK